MIPGEASPEKPVAPKGAYRLPGFAAPGGNRFTGLYRITGFTVARGLPVEPIQPKRGNPHMVKGAPSLNPSGRPKGAAGLARYIAEQTRDGQELVDRLLEMVRSKKAAARDVATATFALLDRLAGRPMQPSELALTGTLATPSNVFDWSRIPIDERRALLARLRTEPNSADDGGPRPSEPQGLDDDCPVVTTPVTTEAP